MKRQIDWAERGLIPDGLIRFGIRRLLRSRLESERQRAAELGSRATEMFARELAEGPLAVHTDTANVQHYELPPPFFLKVLGPRLKYSSCVWSEGVKTLSEAEDTSLKQVCERAAIEDGMDIMDLGCGWGSFTLWIGEHYPDCRVFSLSNSTLQQEFIRSRCEARGFGNVELCKADIVDFATDRKFDRIVSIEMFEHLRNYELLMQRIRGWLKDEGKLFVHVFSHREHAYLYETSGDDNWAGRYFFTGGLMPSHDLLLFFQKELENEEHWWLPGWHYRKTADAWIEKMDADRSKIMPVMVDTYGKEDADRWFQRWRIFFMACSELWGYEKGREWGVTHYRFAKR